MTKFESIAASERMPLPTAVEGWFAQRGWAPRRHQLEMLDLARAGRSALLVAPTGAGKTLAGFLPTICDLARDPAEGLHTLYVSPLKALAVDVQRNLLGPIEEMGLPIRVETRSGDTPSDRKARQRIRPPQILLTTPKSLSLLLSYPDSAPLFAGLKTVVVDEIHAFAKEKRGDLLSLVARPPADPRARPSPSRPQRDHFRSRSLSRLARARRRHRRLSTSSRAIPARSPISQILIPEGKVPWSGHSGRYAARQVMELIEAHKTTLVFCNTRSLAELIFQDLWKVNDDGLGIGIHHGSLALEARRKVEAAMGAGKLRALVATASLDLGIDWGDVDLVVQMGAPKGSSRLLQRIGRANHRLDEPSQGHDRARQPLRISGSPRRLGCDRRRRARPRNLPPRRDRRARPAHPWPRLRRPDRRGRIARRNPLRRALRRPDRRPLRRGAPLHRHRRLLR